MECSLFLKHRRGKIITILQCTNFKSPEAKIKTAVLTPPAEVKKLKKKRNKKRLEALLSYLQRLVEEKGLPPSRLMLQHAAAAPPMTPAQKPEQEATSKLSEPPAQPTEQNKPDASMDESTNVQLVEGEESNDSQSPSIKCPSC